jgi:hypothetical protein
MVTLGVYLIGSGSPRRPGRRPLVHLPLRHPGHRRHGHRRRVRRHQLGHRRDDPGASTGAGSTSPSTAPTGRARFLGTWHLWVLNHISAPWGWRIAFLVGPVLALCIIYVRRNLPESPRWQIMHGREEQAEASIGDRRRRGKDQGRAPAGRSQPGTRDPADRPRSATSPCCTLFRQYPARSVLARALMITQSFLYNAIFFTYGLVLEFFFHVKAADTAYYFIAFAAGNLAGPLTSGGCSTRSAAGR